MYESYFGLNTEPFSVAPDPRFMYLSDVHREALRQLEIGLRGGAGFVLRTGEIGAGGDGRVKRLRRRQTADFHKDRFAAHPRL